MEGKKNVVIAATVIAILLVVVSYFKFMNRPTQTKFGIDPRVEAMSGKSTTPPAGMGPRSGSTTVNPQQRMMGGK